MELYIYSPIFFHGTDSHNLTFPTQHSSMLSATGDISFCRTQPQQVWQVNSCSPPLVSSCRTQIPPVVVVQEVKSSRFLAPQQSSVSCVHMVLHLLIQTLSSQSHPLSCTSSSQSSTLEAPVDYSLSYSDSTGETTVPSGAVTHRHLQIMIFIEQNDTHNYGYHLGLQIIIYSPPEKITKNYETALVYFLGHSMIFYGLL